MTFLHDFGKLSGASKAGTRPGHPLRVPFSEPLLVLTPTISGALRLKRQVPISSAKISKVAYTVSHTPSFGAAAGYLRERQRGETMC